MAGTGDADELRAAAEAEHAAAAALLADAPGFLDREGGSPSRTTLDRVAETIRAVALDDEARDGFEAGRLTRERAATGFGPLGAAAPAPRRERPRKPAPAKRPARKGAPHTAAAGETRARQRAARDAARRALKAARADHRAGSREVKAAERELADAQREAKRAQRRLETATADLERARARESDAAERVARAEDDLGS